MWEIPHLTIILLFLFFERLRMIATVTNETLLIHRDSGIYPVMLTDLPARHTNISFGPTVPLDFITALGYSVVNRVDHEEGDVVTELAPVIVDSEYRQSYSVRPFTEEEILLKLDSKKQNLIKSYKMKLREALAKGYVFVHGDASHCLQIRESDYSKLLLVIKTAEMRVNAGDAAVSLLRVMSNEVIVMSPIEVIDVIEGALRKVESLHETFYQLENNILSAKTYEALVDIDDPFLETK